MADVDSQVFTANEVATMSEPDLTFELTRVRAIRTGIRADLSDCQKRQQQLEQKNILFGDYEAKLVEALTKLNPGKPLPDPDRPHRHTGMRIGSRKQRIWAAVNTMLGKRGGPVHKDEIADHIVELGLLDEDRRNALFNLLSEFKKANLIDTDYHGNWFLPYQRPNGASWSPTPTTPGGNGMSS